MVKEMIILVFNLFAGIIAFQISRVDADERKKDLVQNLHTLSPDLLIVFMQDGKNDNFLNF